MARGNSKTQHRGQVYYAKITGLKEGEQVRFDMVKKDPETNKYVTEGTEKMLSGHMVGAIHDTWTYQGELKDRCKIVLNDPTSGNDGETYYVEFSPTSGIGRSIINSLLGATNFLSDVKISLYNNKDNGYASVGMYLGGERMNWKYKPEDLNKYVSETTEKAKDASGKLVTKTKKNYVELNEFLLNEFKNKIVKQFENGSASVIDHQDTQPAATAEAADDGLPF